MPQEPKRRHSKTRKRVRRASITLKQAALINCSNCGALSLPHQACKSCGFYKNKQVNQKTEVKITKA